VSGEHVKCKQFNAPRSKLINKELEAMKLEVIDPGLKIQYVQDEQGMDTCACRELGKKTAKALQLGVIIRRKNGA